MAKSTALVKRSDAVASRLDHEQTLKASKALLAHIKKAATEAEAAAEKKSLLEDSEATSTPVWLTLTTLRHIHDSNRLQPSKIILPHSLNTDAEATICIITADPQRAYKNIVASEEFPDALRQRITRVIDVPHLTKKFKSYEAQRKLRDEHDVFLADDRIINRLPKALGKAFFKSTTKRPIPVVLMASRQRVDGKRVAAPKGGKKTKRDPTENVNARPTPEIVAEIEKALGAALVHLAPGTNTAVKVGYASWTAKQIAENVEAVSSELVRKFVPQQWDNVRSLFIKGPETAALPIWQTDQLWVDDSQVLADGSEAAKAIEAKRVEKANIGKKRKSLPLAEDGAAEDVTENTKTRSAKKAKKEPLPESNDGRLDQEIAARKERLKKQKSAAKKALVE